MAPNLGTLEEAVEQVEVAVCSVLRHGLREPHSVWDVVVKGCEKSPARQMGGLVRAVRVASNVDDSAAFTSWISLGLEYGHLGEWIEALAGSLMGVGGVFESWAIFQTTTLVAYVVRALKPLASVEWPEPTPVEPAFCTVGIQTESSQEDEVTSAAYQELKTTHLATLEAMAALRAENARLRSRLVTVLSDRASEVSASIRAQQAAEHKIQSLQSRLNHLLSTHNPLPEPIAPTTTVAPIIAPTTTITPTIAPTIAPTLPPPPPLSSLPPPPPPLTLKSAPPPPPPPPPPTAHTVDRTVRFKDGYDNGHENDENGSPVPRTALMASILSGIDLRPTPAKDTHREQRYRSPDMFSSMAESIKALRFANSSPNDSAISQHSSGWGDSSVSFDHSPLRERALPQQTSTPQASTPTSAVCRITAKSSPMIGGSPATPSRPTTPSHFDAISSAVKLMRPALAFASPSPSP